MQIPLKINFRHMDPSAPLEEKIRERAEKLERFTDHITSIRVTVDQEHKRHNQGNLFSVKIEPITLDQ